MKTLLLATAAGASLACGTVHAECIVADPSPTPLTIRTAPYGRVVSTIRNGIEVNIFDRSSDSHGREWVFVGIGDLPLGWVYRDFVVCKGER